MTQDRTSPYAEFVSADAIWRAEIVLTYGASLVEAYAGKPEGQGRPGTLLRSAWDARECARTAWQDARDCGTAKI